MARFEELQELWQSQPQPEPPVLAAQSRGMAAALRRFRRRQSVINGFKLVMMTLMTWFLLSRPGLSVLTVLGEGLLVVGFITAIVNDWRIQSAIARLDFTSPSVGFVDATLERLRDPNAPFRRTWGLATALVAAGVNLMAGPPASETLRTSVVSHAAVTLIACLVFGLGLKVRAKRYALDYKPLVERLAAIKAALEEQAQ